MYDDGDARHWALADLGRVCALRVREALASGALETPADIGVLRRRVRELLDAELTELDSLGREVDLRKVALEWGIGIGCEGVSRGKMAQK